VNPPPCPNFIERQGCAQSDTFVEKETDKYFTIRCRTCRAINIFPKTNEEGRGRYEGGLRQQAIKHAKEEELRRKRTYSNAGGR
jgi:hypothetical protein